MLFGNNKMVIPPNLEYHGRNALNAIAVIKIVGNAGLLVGVRCPEQVWACESFAPRFTASK